MEEVIQKELWQGFISELEQKVANNSIQPEDFKTALYHLKEAKYKIQGLLDLLQDDDEEMKKLYRLVANENYADMVDDLNSLGYRYRMSSKNLKKKDLNNDEKALLKKQKDFTDDINRMGYRIMEQVRVGKRDNTFYSLLRIYMSNNLPFDKKLLFAFKHPNNEIFKILIFSFLSGIIDEKTNTLSE